MENIAAFYGTVSRLNYKYNLRHFTHVTLGDVQGGARVFVVIIENTFFSDVLFFLRFQVDDYNTYV